MGLNSLSPQPGSDSLTDTPLRPHRSAPVASEREIRPDLPVSPFETSEGRFHHRCPSRLSERIQQLEREDARKANIISDQADEIARLAVQLAAMRSLTRSEVREVDCPACHAEAGAKCFRVDGTTPREANHSERVRAATLARTRAHAPESRAALTLDNARSAAIVVVVEVERKQGKTFANGSRTGSWTPADS